MMIRFHDQNVNAQTKLNADFLTKEDKIIQNMKKKMKKRMNELKNVYDKLYISDDDEKKVVRKTTTQTFTTIRFLCYTSFTRRLFDKNTERKKT
jgi:dihydroorotase